MGKNGLASKIVKLLEKDARMSVGQLAKLLRKKQDAVRSIVRKLEKEGIIVGYKTIINRSLLKKNFNEGKVRALIEVKITPRKGYGFDLVAQNIYRFNEVKSCYLMSGTYDLLLEVEGDDLHKVATFVSQRLATMEGVRETTSHFILKKYKENGVTFEPIPHDKRINISY
jgi:DNA-binding Lrp family transcriptional regulator